MSSIEGIYNVVDFGADRSGAQDSSQSIQNAIHAASSAGGGSVYLPVGVYLISQAIIMDKANVGLIGNRGALLMLLKIIFSLYSISNIITVKWHY